MQMGKPVNVEVWDIFENSGGVSGGANTSPRIPEIRTAALGEELTFFGIDFFKGQFNTGAVTAYKSGRVRLTPTANADNSLTAATVVQSWPFLAYTLESSSDGYIANFRMMHR
jgi:hypothetical protein